jgi:hypothetical protein
MVADGEGPQVQALLLRRFRGSPLTQNAARTAAQLWAAAGARKSLPEEAEAQARRAGPGRGSRGRFTG